MSALDLIRSELEEELNKAIDEVFAHYGIAFSCDATGIAEELIETALDLDK